MLDFNTTTIKTVWQRDRHEDNRKDQGVQNKPYMHVLMIFDKCAKAMQRQRTIFLTTGGGKLVLHMSNNKARTFAHIPQSNIQNGQQVDQRPKQKKLHYKALRRKYRKNTS